MVFLQIIFKNGKTLGPDGKVFPKWVNENLVALPDRADYKQFRVIRQDQGQTTCNN